MNLKDKDKEIGEIFLSMELLNSDLDALTRPRHY